MEPLYILLELCNGQMPIVRMATRDVDKVREKRQKLNWGAAVYWYTNKKHPDDITSDEILAYVHHAEKTMGLQFYQILTVRPSEE